MARRYQMSLAWSICSVLMLVGCEHPQVRVEPPPMPAPPTAENDLIRAEYVAMTPGVQGRGVVALRVTNKTTETISIGGTQGASIPAKDGTKAWLVYRGDNDISRLSKTGVSIELHGGEAKVDVDVPDEGVMPLTAGASRMVLVAFEMPETVKDLSIDLSPIVVSNSVHSPDGQLRALYLTVPVKDRPSLREQAKKMIEQTKFGFQLTSDDI